jgi:anti-sigma factor (TIGR02949 family)
MTNDHDLNDIEDIDCTEAIDKLYAYLDGELISTEAINKLEYHMQHCHSCFSRSQLERKLTSRMKDATKEKPSKTLQHRLRNIIDQL